MPSSLLILEMHHETSCLRVEVVFTAWGREYVIIGEKIGLEDSKLLFEC